MWSGKYYLFSSVSPFIIPFTVSTTDWFNEPNPLRRADVPGIHGCSVTAAKLDQPCQRSGHPFKYPKTISWTCSPFQSPSFKAAQNVSWNNVKSPGHAFVIAESSGCTPTRKSAIADFEWATLASLCGVNLTKWSETAVPYYTEGVITRTE